jgi:nucleotide-binding universal stress UspA family protein
MRTITCGIDDPQSARAAARVARALSGELGLDLVFVRVLDDPTTRVDATADRLAHLCGSAYDRDAVAQWVVAVGHPADQLVAAAAKTEATLIVVGSHGPRSSSLGSISAEVSRRAPCPAVVVPPGTDHGFHGSFVIGRSTGELPDTASAYRALENAH